MISSNVSMFGDQTQPQLEKYLQLARSLSPMQYYVHLKKYGCVDQALKALNFKTDINLIKAEIDQVYGFGAGFLINYNQINIKQDNHYPLQLKQLTCPPPVLIYKGNIDLLNRSCVSVVGSRQASLAGLKLAGIISKDLGIAGQVIVSGLAIGIDSQAHKASVKTGTIGVLGAGINVIYPLENKELQEEIGSQGLLLSEFPFNASVKRESFPSRNRIIAGLSWGTVVVEAGLKSGSMITAKHVISQGRDLFAVPGQPLDSRAAGCNSLIKNGAILVENAQDIMNNWHAINKSGLDHDFNKQIFQDQTEVCQDIEEENAQEMILNLLSFAPTYIDEIVRHTQLPSNVVRTILVELEIEGKILIDQAFKVFKI